MTGSSVAETWSGRAGFILATIGSAIGPGNIWQFPFLTGQNGGAAFVLVYILCLLLVAFPLLIAEVMLGRHGKASPPVALRRIGQEAGLGRHMGKAGGVAILMAILVLAFISAVSGWMIAYGFKAAGGAFENQDASAVADTFSGFLAQPGQMILWHSVFMALTIFFVVRGVRGGIEQLVSVAMPVLAVLLIALVGYAAVEGQFYRAFTYLFAPTLEGFTPSVWVAAIGQAFFSLGVGVGGLMMYGAYVGREVKLIRACGWVALADTAVALLAGLAIFPLVFANGLDPAEGPGLVFITLPIAFGALPGGVLFGTLFFILLVIASLTSTVSVASPVVGYLLDRGLTRRTAGMIVGVLAWLLGLLTVFSFNLLADFHPLDAIPAFAGQTFFELSLSIVNQTWLPVGGLLFAFMAAWALPRTVQDQELGTGIATTIWRLCTRYLAPVGVLAVLVYGWLG